MQDIDFDELDRAVNSVGSPSQAPAVGRTSLGAHADSVHAPATSPSALPDARRSSGGRFMDVVHPSSDMRSAPVERSAPREAVPLRPVESPERSSTDQPDPLDFHGFTFETETPAEAPAPEQPAPQEDATQPLDSPFLADAKVEKRPLGAFSTAEQPAAPAETPAEPELLLDAPDDIELIEAESESTPESPVVEEVPQEEAPAIVPTPDPTPIEQTPVGPTSITQQYKEQPSTVNQPSGAIFDTESYHKPVVPVPKKKSGAFVVIWIAALVLVGAGAGAAVYFFILPML